MPERRTLIMGAIGVGFLIFLYVILTWLGSGDNPQQEVQMTPMATTESASAENLNTLAVATLEPATAAPLVTIAVPGGDCGNGCIWSRACVANGMTLPEQNGMARVYANSCVPVESRYWNITPDNPFWGMPCSYDTIGACVWSRQCVTMYGKPAEKNGLVRVVPNSCQIVP